MTIMRKHDLEKECTFCGCKDKRLCSLNAGIIMCDHCTAILSNGEWANLVCDICTHKTSGICKIAKRIDLDAVDHKIMCHYAYPFCDDPWGF